MHSLFKKIFVIFILGFCLSYTLSDPIYASSKYSENDKNNNNKDKDNKGKDENKGQSEKEKLYASIDNLGEVKKIAAAVMIAKGKDFALNKILSKHVQATAEDRWSYFYTNIPIFLKNLINYGIYNAQAYTLDKENGGITLFAEVENPSYFAGKPTAIGHYVSPDDQTQSQDTRVVAVCIAIKNMVDERVKTGSHAWDYTKSMVINAFPAKTLRIGNACEY